MVTTRIHRKREPSSVSIWAISIQAISSALRSHEAVIAPARGPIVVPETGTIKASGPKIITVHPVGDGQGSVFLQKFPLKVGFYFLVVA
ncbi:hypothetical protein OE766_22990 [Pararhizobium sp. YC-54]|uniref:hypothetical protein n=1 Tax=Pararhizobium sp. YC-54 TaxID=2986920 RepID=UPI0021F770BB|nr:hypothetical protein [Pararhizobium sp. YC-54]MCW0001100.1 hypothetical protein [Pararhizobium sp. YC-54]